METLISKLTEARAERVTLARHRIVELLTTADTPAGVEELDKLLDLIQIMPTDLASTIAEIRRHLLAVAAKPLAQSWLGLAEDRVQVAHRDKAATLKCHDAYMESIKLLGVNGRDEATALGIGRDEMTRQRGSAARIAARLAFLEAVKQGEACIIAAMERLQAIGSFINRTTVESDNDLASQVARWPELVEALRLELESKDFTQQVEAFLHNTLGPETIPPPPADPPTLQQDPPPATPAQASREPAPPPNDSASPALAAGFRNMADQSRQRREQRSTTRIREQRGAY